MLFNPCVAVLKDHYFRMKGVLRIKNEKKKLLNLNFQLNKWYFRDKLLNQITLIENFLIYISDP